MLLLTMLFCSSCYTEPSFFTEVNLPSQSDPLEQTAPVIVLYASDFPVYPQSHKYLGTIRMNHKGWRYCEVEPLVFLRVRARRVGANVVYIKFAKELHDAERDVPLCDNLLADFLKVDDSFVRQYDELQRTEAFNSLKTEALK